MSLNDWVGKNKIAGQRVLGIDASRANSSTRTGTEWYAYQVIQGLKKLVPEDIQVVLYSKEPLRDGLEKLPANWESRVLRWPPGRFWTQMRLSWEMLVRPPDVLFVPAHTLPLLTPRKSIITLHDLGFVAVPEAYTWGERLYHRFSAWFAARRACQILTVSNFSRQEFSRLLGVAEERLAVTPLACDRQMFRADFSSDEVEAVVQRYNIDQPYFLFVGRLENKKNLRLLLTAFDEYILGGGKASLVLVGKRG
ncbi:glycosyltransferase, partial [Patescibacteria group bacterium]|nr:glycosyltransferase [Patescibacteria group bacterium]